MLKCIKIPFNPLDPCKVVELEGVPVYRDMQKEIGCDYIDVVPNLLTEAYSVFLVVDENGVYNQPRNRNVRAAVLYGSPIVGDALLVSEGYVVSEDGLKEELDFVDMHEDTLNLLLQILNGQEEE